MLAPTSSNEPERAIAIDDERPHPLQIQAWRAMGAEGRARLGIELRRKARRWKLEALRAQHPDWSEMRAQTELARIYLRGHT